MFVFIDLQAKLLEKISASESIVSRSIFLLEGARILGIPFLSTSQYKKWLGELDPLFAARLDGECPDKASFSCCGDPQIRERLMSSGRKWVAVSGVETHICVTQTTLDLLREDYRVAVVADAVGARGRLDHDLGIKRMEQAGALLVTAEMLFYELLGRSDSQAFKKLLPLIKNT
jgi:hypothetical protein